MKTLLALLMITSLAQANTVCTTNTGIGEPTIALEFLGNNAFAISMWGHSRNTYAAVYEVDKKTNSTLLIKVQDESTWKDMPKHLWLKSQLSILPENNYVLHGLLEKDIFFSSQNCVVKGE